MQHIDKYRTTYWLLAIPSRLFPQPFYTEEYEILL